MGAHEFNGAMPSRAGRRQSKLGPGIIDADRLEALLGAGRTCRCGAFGGPHRPDQCASQRAGANAPANQGILEAQPKGDQVMMKCHECGKEVDAIAQNLYYAYCSAKCARVAAIKREGSEPKEPKSTLPPGYAALPDLRQGPTRVPA